MTHFLFTLWDGAEDCATFESGMGAITTTFLALVPAGGRIVAIEAAGSTGEPGSRRVDAGGGYLIPGLWDMHVHLMLNGHGDYAHWDKTYLPQLGSVIMPASARQLLMAGITSARDLGA